MRVKHSLKRLTSLLLCLVMLMQTVVVASAAGFNPKAETPEPTAADAFEFSKGTITDYVGSDTNVVIPAAIDGTPVTSIGQAAFMDKSIENAVIPSTVKYVGDYAFDACDDLNSLYFYGDVPSNLDSPLMIWIRVSPFTARIRIRATMSMKWATISPCPAALRARWKTPPREVSLSLNRFIALSVASGYFRMVRNRYQPCFP